MSAYSHLKILRHPKLLQVIQAGGVAPPAHVQLILSDLCNQSCAFCAYRSPTYTSSQRFFVVEEGTRGLRRDAEHQERNYNPNRMITAEKAREIIDDCADLGVAGLQLTGGGEPTVNPAWTDAVTYARARQLKVALVTNGVQIGRATTDQRTRAALSCLSWIRVSIDAGAPATYAAIRNTPDLHWEHAWSAVRAAARMRDFLGDGLPTVGVGFVVTPQNWREIPDAVRLAREAGADNIRIGAEFTAEGMAHHEEYMVAASNLCIEARQLATDRFHVISRFGEKLGDLAQGRPNYQRCGYQEVTTYVGADLNVYRCCVLAYNDAGFVGSIKERRFRDLWLDHERAAGMRAFDARGCERCQFNSINRVLAEAFGEGSDHDAFV